MKRSPSDLGRWGLVVALAGALSACRSSAPAPSKPLGGNLQGALAQVGGWAISPAVVALISDARSEAPRIALDAAIHDALLAREALDRHPEWTRAFGVQATLARALLQRVRKEVAAAGPPSEAEMQSVAPSHWLELDRPDAARTVHVVVRLKSEAAPEAKRQALELAQALRTALEPIAATVQSRLAKEGAPAMLAIIEAFKEAVKAVPSSGLETVAEPLPPVSADGRVVEVGGSHFDPAFAAGAAALRVPGELSQPILSSFGAHIILLLERVPGYSASPAERVERLSPEIMGTRIKTADRELRAKLRSATPPAYESAVDAALATVRVEP